VRVNNDDDGFAGLSSTCFVVSLCWKGGYKNTHEKKRALSPLLEHKTHYFFKVGSRGIIIIIRLSYDTKTRES